MPVWLMERLLSEYDALVPEHRNGILLLLKDDRAHFVYPVHGRSRLSTSRAFISAACGSWMGGTTKDSQARLQLSRTSRRAGKETWRRWQIHNPQSILTVRNYLSLKHRVFEVPYMEIVAQSRHETVLVLKYSGIPEPPTLNAILILKQYFQDVTLFRDNLYFPAASYPETPTLLEIGREIDVRSAMKKSALWKLSRFVRYCTALGWHLRHTRYPIVIIHDYLALLAFSLVRGVVGYQGLTWFNSYDCIDQVAAPIRPWSLMDWVVRRHERLFSELDYFSAPAGERMRHYPVNCVRRQSFVIPNYPAIAFYRNFSRPRRLSDEKSIRLIYQGALGRGHGFEDIIKILDRTVVGRPLELVLKGWIDKDYKRELLELAAKYGVEQRLSFEGFGLYRTVPELASRCTVGIAIYTAQNIMNTTLGTASCKTYEYAAVGLPVILYDTPHFRHHLGERRWAFFTTLSETSLLHTLEAVAECYDAAACAACEDFREEFNFERVFTPALRTVLKQMFA
jgi:glycosyltransferase involved in cell wall biosynthesis